jgi:hypothetical protein
MVSVNEYSAFGNLNDLALRLDIQLGIEKRKLILAGNEKLTLATNAQSWTNWITGVENRLKDFVDNETAKNLLIQTRRYPPKPEASVTNEN